MTDRPKPVSTASLIGWAITIGLVVAGLIWIAGA